MTKDKALRMAYAVLSFHAQVSDAPAEPIQKALDAIEEALAQPVQPVQEPDCLKCGNNRQVWTNQITGLKTCHRVGCTWAQPVQEPVAWGVFEGNLHDMFFTQEEAREMAFLKGHHAEVQPLYTAPPLPVQEPDLTAVYMSGLYDGKKQRPWVGLTNDELMNCAVFKHFDYDPPYIDKDGVKFVASHEVSLRATYEKIEQALKEKNT